MTLAVLEQQAVPPGVEITPTALKINVNISYEEYDALLKKFLAAEQSIQWLLGDLLAYGESAWGEKYTQAVELTGRSVSTVQNWVWVATHIAPERRREDVRWSIYRELTSLPVEEQEEWLDAVQDGNWTADELRKALRETPTGDSPPRQPPLQPQPEGDSPLGREEIEPDPERRVKWTISVSVPETANLESTQQAIRDSSEALRVILEEDVKADPVVTVAVDVSA